MSTLVICVVLELVDAEAGLSGLRTVVIKAKLIDTTKRALRRREFMIYLYLGDINDTTTAAVTILGRFWCCLQVKT